MPTVSVYLGDDEYDEIRKVCRKDLGNCSVNIFVKDAAWERLKRFTEPKVKVKE